MIKFYSPVYYVYSEQDSTVLLAMRIKTYDNNLEWFDGTKERIMTIAEITDDSPDHFVFKRAERENWIYTFVPMSLEIYEQQVKSRLIAPKDFDSLEALNQAFLETLKHAW